MQVAPENTGWWHCFQLWQILYTCACSVPVHWLLHLHMACAVAVNLHECWLWCGEGLHASGA
jgi:hypothetical protein